MENSETQQSFLCLFMILSKVNFKSYLNVSQMDIRLGASGVIEPAAQRK